MTKKRPLAPQPVRRPRTPGSGRPSLGGIGVAPHVSITMTAEMAAEARLRIGDGNLSRACQRAVAYWLANHDATEKFVASFDAWRVRMDDVSDDGPYFKMLAAREALRRAEK